MHVMLIQHTISKLVSVLLLTSLLTACDKFNTADSMMEEYLSRMSRVFASELSMSDRTTLPSLPSMKYRRFDIPPYTVNMLQFLSLYGCELQVVIGEKNSVLGKVMQAVERLNYELRFLAAAEICVRTLDDEPKLKQAINDAITFKQQQLSNVIWNAIWATDEIGNFLSYATDYYPVSASKTETAGLSRLNQLNKQWQSLNLMADTAVLSELQHRWQYDSSAGQLLKTIHMLNYFLEHANSILKRQKSLCLQQKVTPRAERMKGFFFAVYIAKVQPYLAKVYQDAAPLISELNQLASLTAPPSNQFEDYRQKVLIDNWNDYKNHLDQHTRLWQRHLSQCGMQPGQQ